MNSLAWIGMIVWGIVVTAFGLASAGPGSELQAQDLIFLIAGGLVTCLIGAVGLLGYMGWIPALRGEKSYS